MAQAARTSRQRHLSRLTLLDRRSSPVAFASEPSSNPSLARNRSVADLIRPDVDGYVGFLTPFGAGSMLSLAR